MAVPAWIEGRSEVRHIHRRAPRPGLTAPFPAWVPQRTRDVLAGQGIAALWRHQAVAAQAAFEGRHVAISTSTASGKSLAYLLPVHAATVDGALGHPIEAPRWSVAARQHTALYLAPTKALAHDQARRAAEFGGRDWRIGTLDGDSDQAEAQVRPRVRHPRPDQPGHAAPLGAARPRPLAGTAPVVALRRDR